MARVESVSQGPPPEVIRLLAERSTARSARDWAAADALRARIRDIGWEVSDGPAGSQLRPALPLGPAAPVVYARPEDLESLLGEPATLELTIVVVADEAEEDLQRCLRGVAQSAPAAAHELVLVANAPSFDLAGPISAAALPIEPVVLATTAKLGWADAVDLGLRRSRGEVTLLLDTSIEPTGDIATPLLAAFSDPSVGLAGPFGVRSRDLRHFDDAPPGEVDAILGYCLAVRRAVLCDAGLFDHRFRFYRNADLDFSFQARAAGWRAIATEPLPVTRHEHRGFASLPADEVERLSKRNFYRFLKHWGDRRDLLLDAAPPQTHGTGAARAHG